MESINSTSDIIDVGNGIGIAKFGRKNSNRIKFEYRQVKNMKKVINNPNGDIYEKKLFCYIYSPGSVKSVPFLPVNDEIIEEYRNEYEAFVRSGKNDTVGTLIETVPFLKEWVDALKAQNIYTVEQVAAWSDASMSLFGMGARELRQKSIDYLSNLSNAGTANSIQMLSAENVELKKAMSDLMNKIEAMGLKETKTPAKRGRPPKEVLDGNGSAVNQ